MDKDNYINIIEAKDFGYLMCRLIHITKCTELLVDLLEHQHPNQGESSVYSITRILLEYTIITQEQYVKIGKKYNLPI